MKGVPPFARSAGVLLLGPMLLQRAGGPVRGGKADETLVIITPHNEATRYEFARAFRRGPFCQDGAERLRRLAHGRRHQRDRALCRGAISWEFPGLLDADPAPGLDAGVRGLR